MHIFINKNFIAQVAKIKYEGKNTSLPFTLDISYWEIIFSAQELEKVTIFWLHNYVSGYKLIDPPFFLLLYISKVGDHGQG